MPVLSERGFLMRNKLASVLLVGCCLLWTAGRASAAEIKWAKSFSAAMEDAKKSNKLVMVDMYTDWCHWCKVLDSDTYPDAKVVALSEKLVAVKVDAEKEGVQQAKKYNITGYPTILFLDGNGKLVGRVVGFQKAPEFADSMTKYMGYFTEVPALEAKMGKDPKDTTAAARLITIYTDQGDTAKAGAMLKLVETNDPKNAALAPAYLTLGDAALEDHKTDAALPLYRKAAALAQQPADAAKAHFSLGMCYYRQQKLKESDAELTAVVANKDCPADLKMQADALLKTVKTVETNDPKDPALPSAYLALGEAAMEEQKADVALPLFRKAAALSKDPEETAKIHFSMAICYYTQQKIKDSLAELETVAANKGCPANMKKQAEAGIKQMKAMLAEKK